MSRSNAVANYRYRLKAFLYQLVPQAVLAQVAFSVSHTPFAGFCSIKREIDILVVVKVALLSGIQEIWCWGFVWRNLRYGE